MPHYALLCCLFLIVTSCSTAVAEEATMPITLFRYYTLTPDETLPNIHPLLPETRVDDIIISVQEKAGLLRVAAYAKAPTIWQRGDRLNFINNTGKDLTGLPAGFPLHPKEGEELNLQIGEYNLKPTIPPVQKAGSKEWRTYFRWQHVHDGYYYVIMYRGLYKGGASVIYEELVRERDGNDVKPFLGESLENPGPIGFNPVFGGEKITIYPSLGTSVNYPIMYLTPVYEEKDLPENFPKNLVRWIP